MSKRFAIIISVFALMVGLVGLTQSLTVAAGPNPPGNNGTIKIGEVDADSDSHGNDPHIDGCSLNVKFFGYDQGNRSATITFESQNPTPNTLVSPVGPQAFNFVGGGSGNQLDATAQYTLAFQGTPHPVQGYHVKVTVHATGSKGNDTKSKVFWVEGCKGTSSFRTACESLTLLKPTTTPSDAAYQYYLDGQAIALGTHQVQAGAHTLVLKVNGVTVDTDNFTTVACPAGTSKYELACESLTLIAPTGVAPQGANYQYYLDGQTVAVGTHEVTTGQHILTLKVNGTLVDTDNLSVEECPTTGTSSYRVACESLTLLVPTGVAPQDADYQYYLDGNEIALGSHEVEAGAHTLVLKVNGVTVDTDELSIEECEEEGEPNVSASLVCNAETKTFTMTITNSGNTASNITLNGEAFVLEAGESVNKNILDNGEGVLITLLVDGQVYGEGDNAFDGTRPFFCKQGNGGGETPGNPTNPTVPTVPTAPVKEVTSLPRTGGVAPLVSLIVVVSTAMAAVAGYLWQNRAGSQL